MINTSESVHMAFNADKQCEIISSKTMDLNITYLQEDGDYAVKLDYYLLERH